MFDKMIMTSLELVAKINEFRKEEGHGKKLAHYDFCKSIRSEFGERNISPSSYTTEQNKQATMYELTRRQAMIMGMKESGTVRHRVMDL